MIRLAVVGVGGYGFSLAEQIVAAAPQIGCMLVAAADNRMGELTEQADWLAAQGVELFHSVEEMFSRLQGRCEGVYIGTGIPSHTSLTLAAARAGYHVHLEKPPAATVQEMDQMSQALRETGRFCLVGVQSMHSTDLLAVKQRIVEGRLGQIRSVTCHALWPRDAEYYSRNDWAGRLRSGQAWVLDGPATNACFHQVANALLLATSQPGLAHPAAVRAELYAAGEVESHNLAAMRIRTTEGVSVQLILAHCTLGKTDPLTEIVGSKGRATWPAYGDGTIHYEDGTEEKFQHDAMMRRRMIGNFVEAIRSERDETLRFPLSEARQAVLALNGAHESTRRIHRVEGPAVRIVDSGTPKARAVVEGLDELILQASREGVLLSELRSPPAWARRTEEFELDGYCRFPQIFSA